VQELVDYIGQSHYLPGDEERNCDESEQRVKAHITCCHSRMPFDPVNYVASEYRAMPASGYRRRKRGERIRFYSGT
jgi:exodeoxyribonuclease V gamma subunit